MPPRSIPVFQPPAAVPAPVSAHAPTAPAPTPMPAAPVYAAPPQQPPAYYPAPPQQPPAYYPPPPQPPPMYPPTAQLPALGPMPGYDWQQPQEGLAGDDDMTEMVALVRPPRRRWPVIAVTSGVIVIGVAVMVYVAARSKDDGGAGGVAAPSKPARAPAPAPAPASGSAPAPEPAAGAAVPPPAGEEAPPAAAATFPPGALCKVAFTSSPDAAQVLINGKAIGVTPITHEGPCAGYKATFKRERYQSQTHTVAPGDTTADVRLERPQFKVRVTSRPSGALVKIGGVDAGKTPITVNLPGYETTSIELSRAGSATTTQRVYAGKSGQKVDVKLKPRRR
jgi:hypothetical protein